MPEQFIYPNWHVMFLHFPLGLLGVGVVLEWLGHVWPKSAIKTGGRWMILMGALLAIPTTTLGMYAYRDVVAPQAEFGVTWNEVVQQSHWSDTQWHYMNRHIWYEAIGTGLALIGVVIWLAGSDEARRKLYWPGLVVVTAALALMVVGAWYSGESVYKHGTAVAAATPVADEPLTVRGAREHEPAAETGDGAATAPAMQEETERQMAEQAGPDHAQAGENHQHDDAGHPQWVLRFIPPLQLHVLGVGATLGFAMAAIGLSIRRWSQTGPLPASAIPARIGEPGGPRAAGAPAGPSGAPVPESTAGMPGQPVAPAPAALAPPTILYPIFPARFWLTALIFGLLTAVAGLWVTGDWTLQTVRGPLAEEGSDWMNLRLFWHVVFGVSIIFCTLILALTTRVSQRAKFVVILFVVLLVIAVAGQIWLGTLMLYDSPQGPITGFTQ